MNNSNSYSQNSLNPGVYRAIIKDPLFIIYVASIYCFRSIHVLFGQLVDFRTMHYESLVVYFQLLLISWVEFITSDLITDLPVTQRTRRCSRQQGRFRQLAERKSG